MQQLSREAPGGGLELCFGGGLSCFGDGEAAHMWPSLMTVDAWHVTAGGRSS